MQLELLTQLSLAAALCGYIWNDSKKRNDKTEMKVEILEKRVQKIEDIQGNKLDNLSSDFKEFKHDVNEKLEALRVMIHKEKNIEQQTHSVLKLLLEKLSKENDN